MTEYRYPQPYVNLGYSVAETLDDVTDSVLGIRPFGTTLRLARALAPANVIKKLTNLPKPSEIVDKVLREIESKI